MYHRLQRSNSVGDLLIKFAYPAILKFLGRNFLIACCFPFVVLADMTETSESQTKNNSNPQNTQQAQHDRGQRVYQRFCSICHGSEMQGQPNWRKRKANGRLPAPPHNGDGHTWHHPDNFLFGITKYGLVPPYAPPGYQSDMPAWKDVLSDNDIWAVIAYIKSRWPKEALLYQQQINAQPH